MEVNFQILGEMVGAEFVRCTPGTARTFLRMFELLKGLSGLSEQECFTAAVRIFPAEHAAYEAAVLTGEIPPLVCGPYSNRFAVTFPELN